MKALDPATGQEVDVSPEEAQAGFQAGKLQVPKGAPVPVVSSTGKIGTVDPEHLQKVIEGGGKIVGEDQLHEAALQHQYGGLGGSFAAAGEGLVRGATVGLSDPLAVGAARLFGGDQAAEATRKHLEAEQHVHPWISAGTELAGAALPAVFSGGESAAATATELAGRGVVEGTEAAGALGRVAQESNVMARIGQGVRGLGSAARGIDTAGAGAERLIGGLLGEEAETALGRAAQSAAKTAARGIVEGGLWSAGSAISDSTLENKPLTAEKLFASVGHGALMGGLLGGTLGGLGTLAREGLHGALGAAGPALDSAASEQAYKWLDARVGVSREAAARAGGPEAVGETVLEHVIRPLAEKEGMSALAVDPEQKLKLVEKAADGVGQQIGELVQGNAGAQATLKEFLKPIDDQIAKWRGEVLGEEKVAPLERLRESVVKQFGGAPTGPTTAEGVQRTGAEIGEFLRANPAAAQEFAATGKVPDAALFKTMPAGTPGGVDLERPIPIADMIKVRRAVQDRVFEDIKALDPERRVKVIREVTGGWNELEERVLNKASTEAGEGLAGSKLRELKKTYQRLSIAEQAVRETTARYATNRNLGMSEYLTGIAPGMTALLHGNVLGAAGGFAAALGHKALREHGNAYAALMLDRLSTMGGISSAAGEVDRDVSKAVDRLTSGKSLRLRGGQLAAAPMRREGGDHEARFTKERERVQQIAALAGPIVSEHLQQQTRPMQPHAPELADMLQKHTMAANAFLASKLPPANTTQTLTPNAKPPKVPANQQTSFLRYVDAVEGGPGKILARVSKGLVSPEDIEVLQKVFPESYAEARVKVAHAAAERKTPLDYQARVRLSMLFGLPTDPTLSPAFVQAMQQSYASQPQGASGTAQPAASRAPAQLSVSKAIAGPFERAAGGS